ncbi:MULTISPECIES: hypothetical protein [Paraburkholderia]|uniref:Uncharacterized protein n=1 Tax=Paraburkholderia podalyriae TaxID=1938811 RepID=A0ABR7Q052_9BURK|nr:hypothetical protein [Paraburkholderia podalyriae]MBC8751916.1 hypothetical protein [Paraburkholderia podalyriae]
MENIQKFETDDAFKFYTYRGFCDLHTAAMGITLAIIEGHWTECGRDPQNDHTLTRGVPASNVERAREVVGGIKAALKRQRFA